VAQGHVYDDDADPSQREIFDPEIGLLQSARSTVIAKLTGQTEGLKVGCGGMGVWVVITF
jgi:hypothetical protein